jgi:hypothetical protein
VRSTQRRRKYFVERKRVLIFNGLHVLRARTGKRCSKTDATKRRKRVWFAYGDGGTPMPMAQRDLLRLSKYGLEPVTVEQTDHTKSLREFFDDPRGFVEAAIGE